MLKDLVVAARGLVRTLTKPAAEPAQPAPTTVRMRFDRADETARLVRGGVASPTAIAAFRQSFSDDFVNTWDTIITSSGVERNSAWSGFMNDWAAHQSMEFRFPFHRAPDCLAYKVVGRSAEGPRTTDVFFTRDATRGWVIGQMRGDLSFDATLKRIENERASAKAEALTRATPSSRYHAPITRIARESSAPSTERLEAPSPAMLELVGPDSGVPMHKRGWPQLGAQEQNDLQTLGWTALAWVTVRDGDLAALPPSARQPWEALTPSQRDAATRLGTDRKTWNENVALRADILAHPKILEAFTSLREQGFPIEERAVRDTLLRTARVLGVATPSSKRALLYLLDFHGHLFSEAARQALRDDVTTYNAADIVASAGNPNLGWTAVIAPAPRIATLRGHEAGEPQVVNDASGRSATLVRDVVRVTSPEDVRGAIQRARALGARISIAGRRHSMGAQSAAPGSINLDMMGLNRMQLTPEGTLRVESGATWAQVVAYLAAQEPPLAPKTMQDYDPFTVGGSVSVNIHGRTPGLPPFISTVKSLRLMKADGEVVTCSRTDNAELFRHAVGGYGLFGVVLDVELEVTGNVPVRLTCDVVTEAEFPRRFAAEIAREGTELCWGRFDPTFASGEVIIHTARRIDTLPAQSGFDYERSEALRKVEQWVLQMSKQGTGALEMRWLLEKWLRKADGLGLRSSLLALSADGLRQLWFNEGKESAILQEYFIPAARFQEFTDGLREVRAKHGDLVAATLRDVPEDKESALPFAKCNAIAFVLYYNQELTEAGYKKSGELTRDLIELAARCGGTFYLPYQLHYTPQQLRRAYPEVDAFFATKRRLDPHGVFSNAWFEKYGPQA